MPKIVQIRGVPTRFTGASSRERRWLACRYLLNKIRASADRPTLDEMRAGLRSREETTLSLTPAEAVRRERDRS